MELRDLLVTPIVMILVYVGAYLVRPLVTDQVNRKYFLPAFSCKIFGALAVGFIYQFYYSGGDTYNYHTHGSRHVWEAFMDDPEVGVKLLLSDGSNYQDVYKYASKIYFFTDHASYAIIKLSTLFDLITFSTYSSTALLFAVLGFIGLWLLFLTFYSLYPYLHRWIALATLFIPSVIFWGSGLLKDTITISCVGIATYCVYRIFIQKRFRIFCMLALLLALYTLYTIKIYILLTFLPAVIVWVFMFHFSTIRSVIVRVLVFPFFISAATLLGYFSMMKASQDNDKYSLDAIAKTAQITAYDIRYYTGKDAGSGYSLGELDGTWQSMIRMAPQAINVSLFRPYLWEVRNPLMLLSALESMVLLGLTLYAIFKLKWGIFKALGTPTILFCIVFSVTFAFAVGVSTYNFGTLNRYKIPLLPFYTLAMILLLDYANNERKVDVLDETE